MQVENVSTHMILQKNDLSRVAALPQPRAPATTLLLLGSSCQEARDILRMTGSASFSRRPQSRRATGQHLILGPQVHPQKIRERTPRKTDARSRSERQGARPYRIFGTVLDSDVTPDLERLFSLMLKRAQNSFSSRYCTVLKILPGLDGIGRLEVFSVLNAWCSVSKVR